MSVVSGKKLRRQDKKMSFYVIAFDGETARAFGEDFSVQEAGDLALKNLSCKAGNTHLLKLYAMCCRREECGQT